ncbi:hypothetical protein [Photobacterium iliopiscarium]|uniref:hypothetical protein n=1 Tax=Photobacterium iliopiscarium TaxID=56192 RepID=UPI001E2D7A50|nr:hypothetical protein [Photobacterium iliopiscarium]MCD9489133.1 hypothetical protein [Photobacterium iliopiscarium]MCF2245807.1 hypothetical protein [Photobacterium iliopiscarium]
MSTPKANKNNKSETKTIRFEHDLIALINAVRGDVPFAAWVKRSCINRLEIESDKCIDSHDHVGDLPVEDIQISDNVMDAILNVQMEEITGKQQQQPELKNWYTHNEEIRALIAKCRKKGQGATTISRILNKKGYLTATLKNWSKGSVEATWRKQ